MGGGGGGGGAGNIRAAMAEVGTAKEKQINLNRELEQVTAGVQQARTGAQAAVAKAAESEASAATARVAAGSTTLGKGTDWQAKAAEAEEAYAAAYQANQASQATASRVEQSAEQQLQAEAALQQATDAEKAADTAAQGATRAKPTILAPGWERATEPRTGRPYFVNGTTQETAWEAPLVAAPSGAEAAQQEAATGQARVAKEQKFAEASRVAEAARAEAAERGAVDQQLEYAMQQAAQAAEQWAARVLGSGQSAAAAKAAAQTAEQTELEAAQAAKVAKQKAPRAPKGRGGGGDALPPGWSQEADPQGRAYYVNMITNETAWERPAAPPAPAVRLSTQPGDETEEERTARELGSATTPLEAAQVTAHIRLQSMIHLIASSDAWLQSDAYGCRSSSPPSGSSWPSACRRLSGCARRRRASAANYMRSTGG